MRKRALFGADAAAAIACSMPSMPNDPASTHPVTPSESASGAPPRPAWEWMSIRPGTTYLPRASSVSVASAVMLDSTAAIFVPEIATSRTSLMRSDGSMT